LLLAGAFSIWCDFFSSTGKCRVIWSGNSMNSYNAWVDTACIFQFKKLNLWEMTWFLFINFWALTFTFIIQCDLHWNCMKYVGVSGCVA
jgi:hypothetical protein